MGFPGPMTERQFRAWQAWLDMQWDRPSRTDHYLMQIAACLAGKDLGPIRFRAGAESDAAWSPDLEGTPEQEARWERLRMQLPMMLASGELRPPPAPTRGNSLGGNTVVVPDPVVPPITPSASQPQYDIAAPASPTPQGKTVYPPKPRSPFPDPQGGGFPAGGSR